MKRSGKSGIFLTVFTGALLLLVTSNFLMAQESCQRIMIQDSTLNNLMDPPGYQTAPLGELGRVDKVGTGSQAMILIPGIGFGGGIFKDWMAAHENEYTMYAVTLAGMDGTPAPPSPPESLSFGEMPWTNGAFRAIEKLIEAEKIEKPIVVGHWMTGAQLALRLALKHPDKTKGVIIPSGYACFVMTDTTHYKAHPPLDYRIGGIDKYMIPKWYKTVTRETWDDNNYMPYDYAVNPIRGLRLWREAAEPPLHVWVRYLNEFYCQDITQQLDSLTVPTLLLYPGLEGIFHEPNQNYVHASCITSWAASAPGHKMIKSVTIPNSRICMWFDQPEMFEEEVNKFLAGVK
jgi:pimeloyl-ACP methyl ester carboxylesterase